MFTSLNKKLSEALSALCSKRAEKARQFECLQVWIKSSAIRIDDMYVRNSKIIMQLCLKVELK